MGRPSLDQFLYLKFLSNPVSVAYTGTAGKTAQLEPGMYTLICTTNAYFLQGSTSVAATTSSNPIAAWQPVVFYVENKTTEGYISAIRDAASGTAYVIFGGG